MRPAPLPPGRLTRTGVARRLNCSTMTVRRMLESGELAPVETRRVHYTDGVEVFDADDVDRLAEREDLRDEAEGDVGDRIERQLRAVRDKKERTRRDEDEKRKREEAERKRREPPKLSWAEQYERDRALRRARTREERERLEIGFALDDARRAAIHRLSIDPLDRDALSILQELDDDE